MNSLAGLRFSVPEPATRLCIGCANAPGVQELAEAPFGSTKAFKVGEKLFAAIGGFQLGDIEFNHAHDRRHDTLHLPRIGILQHFA